MPVNTVPPNAASGLRTSPKKRWKFKPWRSLALVSVMLPYPRVVGANPTPPDQDIPTVTQGNRVWDFSNSKHKHIDNKTASLAVFDAKFCKFSS